MEDFFLGFLIIAGLLALIFLVPQMSEKEVQKYLKDRKKRLASGKLNMGDKVRQAADKLEKTTVKGLGIFFKAIFIIIGLLILTSVLGQSFYAIKALYYGSPLIFIFLLWLIFFNKNGNSN
jgi:quinol-cytochrome oxidoreductase complex cytochrome b subunit